MNLQRKFEVISRLAIGHKVTECFDADGDLVTGAASLDSEVSKDGGTFTDVSPAEATEIATSSGMYSLALSATEMTADIVATITKTSTSGAKTAPNVMYTSTRQIDDLAFPNTSGRGMDVDASGGVEVGSFQTGAITSGAFASGAIDNAAFNVTETLTANPATGGIVAASFGAGAIDASAIADNAIDAGAIATDAITAAKIAADAISSSEFAQAAADKIWSSATRNLTALGFTLAASDLAAGIITAAKFAAGAIDAAAIATDALGSLELSSDAITEIRSVASGTSDSGSTTTMVDAARTEADTDYWKGMWIVFTSGNILGQTRLITGFDPATDTITFAPATTQAVSTQTYEILPANRVDIGQWLGSTPNALQSGRVDGYLGAGASGVITADLIATDAIGSAELAASAITEIQAGLSTLDAVGVRSAIGLSSANLDTQLSTIDDFLDTEIAAIKAKTDQLTFTLAGNVDANLQSIDELTTIGYNAILKLKQLDIENADLGQPGVYVTSNTGHGVSINSNGGNGVQITGSNNGMAIDGDNFSLRLDEDITVSDGTINLTEIKDAVWERTSRTLTALGFTMATADFTAGFLTASLIATGAIDADAITTDGANKIADAILSRDIDNIEATAALHSLCTAILKAVSKVADDGVGNIDVYRTDGTTVHMSQAVTVDAGLSPIETIGVAT